MLVSVVMCTYNGEKFLSEQLQSIASQTRVPDELIVCDDCSTDDTLSILNKFSSTAPFNVRIYSNVHNLGVTGNFETALGKAAGDIIFLSDQDDIWRADKISTIAETFERNRTIGMVLTDGEVVDERLRSMYTSLWLSAKVTFQKLKDIERHPVSYLLTHGNIVTGAAAAFSREVVQKALPFPKNMAVLHDAWLAQVASCFAKVKIDPRQTVKYRQHSSQLVGTRKHNIFTGRQHFKAQCEQLQVLQSRIDRGVSDEARKLLQENIEHLQARLNMPLDVPARISAVVKEASSGRYAKYSNGFGSAAKDLLMIV